MRGNARRKKGGAFKEALADRAMRFEGMPEGNAVRFGVKGE